MSARSSLPSYRLVPLVFVTILVIAAPSICMASRIGDDSQTDIAANASAGSLPGADQAQSDSQNDPQASNRDIEVTKATPSRSEFEIRDNLEFAAPAPHAALVTQPEVKPPARLTKCILAGTSLCTAVSAPFILTLTVAQTAMSISDGVTTMDFVKHGYVEVDPVSKILLGRTPSWSRMAPFGAIQVIGSMWLAGRMKASSHGWIRRTWWLPQIMQIGASTFGTVNNLKLLR